MRNISTRTLTGAGIMTERTAEMLAWVERLPPAEADEIADRVLWELQSDAEHEQETRQCATYYRPALQIQ